MRLVALTLAKLVETIHVSDRFWQWCGSTRKFSASGASRFG
jgi:hypothetical protein